MSRPGRLDGRTCLIVGGTSGIGLASARRFLEEGARVVVAGRSPEIGCAALEELAASWVRSGSSSLISPKARAIGRAAVRVCRRMCWADGSTSFCTSPGSAVESSVTQPCTNVRAKRGTSVMQVNAFGAFLTNRRGRECDAQAAARWLAVCGGPL